MKVTNLWEMGQVFVKFFCKKENEKQLLSDWNKMLDDYPILCDLWSDVSGALEGTPTFVSIENIDKMGMSAWGQPAPSKGIDRFVIFVGNKYFANDSFSQRKAILFHELGHLYVYKKGLLAQLRSDWKKGEALFEVFVAPLEIQDPENINSYKEWIKRFYDSYVFDVLKVPDEYFANLWVKENFVNVFDRLMEKEYEESKIFLENGLSNIQKGLMNFPIFSLIRRLDTLVLLIEKKDYLNEFLELTKSSWSELEKYTSKSEYLFLKKFEKKIVKVITSLEDANRLLIKAFEEYIKHLPIKIFPKKCL